MRYVAQVKCRLVAEENHNTIADFVKALKPNSENDVRSGKHIVHITCVMFHTGARGRVRSRTDIQIICTRVCVPVFDLDCAVAHCSISGQCSFDDRGESRHDREQRDATNCLVAVIINVIINVTIRGAAIVISGFVVNRSCVPGCR